VYLFVDAIVAFLHVPSVLKTTLPTTTGLNHISIDLDTNYPFEINNTLTYTIIAESQFTFYIRIPGWTM
jgi:DUF1680 family protein